MSTRFRAGIACIFFSVLVGLLGPTPCPRAVAGQKALYVAGSSPDFVSGLLGDAGFSVELSTTIPSNLSPWDVVVVRNYDACNSQTADYLRDYLSQGGGVVLSGGTPHYLGVSHISEWLGAASYGNAGPGDAILVVDHPFGTDLAAGQLISYATLGACAALESLLPSATELVQWQVGGSRHSTYALQNEWNSGRLFYNSSAALSSLEEQKFYKAGVHWAASPFEILDGVPEYQWNYGCAPTCGGMVIAYWDGQGTTSDLVPGNMPDFGNPHESGVDVRGGPRARGSFDAVDTVIASYEHVRDYWVAKDAFADHDVYGHLANCIADFMGSSQVLWGNKDGGTLDIDIGRGLKRFAAAAGHDFTSGYYGSSGDFTFGDLKREIRFGHPVIFSGHLGSLVGAGHAVVVYGWREALDGKHWVAVRDTWGNGLANDYGIVAELDADGTEWWMWPQPNTLGVPGIAPYIVTAVVTLAPASDNIANTLLKDGFTRIDSSELGDAYSLDRGLGTGTASIQPSPGDPSNTVLRLSNPDPDIVAIETSVSVTDFIEVAFDYLFCSDGKLFIKLDGTALDVLSCPDSGPGAPSSALFAHFDAVYPLSDLGFDMTEVHALRLELTGSGDPDIYLDNLLVTNPHAVPEPVSLAILAAGFAALSLRRTPRRPSPCLPHVGE